VLPDRRAQGLSGAELPRPTVVAATSLEARAVRRALPSARVVRAGVGLRLLPHAGASLAGTVVTCGLAGSLRSDVPPGTVLVPRRVLRPTGGILECDPDLAEALAAAAERLGLEAERGMLATSPVLALGDERAEWAALGCVGIDMETGLLGAERVATVRVVLDTPDRELHPAWRRPISVLWQPGAWAQVPWLAAESRRGARLAAAVLAAAIGGGRG
jgi:phosphorylase superfamily protein